MGETDKSYWLLSETSGIGETRDPTLQRHLPLLEGLRWLSAGWRDFWTRPASSIAYGVGVFVLSVAFVWTLVGFGRDYILFPSLAGFLIVAPFLAIGLYEKSRAIGEGREIGLAAMLRCAPESRRADLLHGPASLPPDAALDAGGGAPVGAVFRRDGVSGPRQRRRDPVRHAIRMGDGDRRNGDRRPVRSFRVRDQRFRGAHAA